MIWGGGAQIACSISTTWAPHKADTMLIRDVKVCPINTSIYMSSRSFTASSLNIHSSPDRYDLYMHRGKQDTLKTIDHITDG